MWTVSLREACYSIGSTLASYGLTKERPIIAALVNSVNLVFYIRSNQRGKIVFTSSEAGLLTPLVRHQTRVRGYCRILRQELQPFNVKMRTIKLRAYRTCLNEAILATALK